MKTKLAMVIDSSTCIDCKGCMAACKVENKVPAGHWRNWIKRQEAGVNNFKKAAGKTAGHFGHRRKGSAPLKCRDIKALTKSLRC